MSCIIVRGRDTFPRATSVYQLFYTGTVDICTWFKAYCVLIGVYVYRYLDTHRYSTHSTERIPYYSRLGYHTISRNVSNSYNHNCKLPTCSPKHQSQNHITSLLLNTKPNWPSDVTFVWVSIYFLVNFNLLSILWLMYWVIIFTINKKSNVIEWY